MSSEHTTLKDFSDCEFLEKGKLAFISIFTMFHMWYKNKCYIFIFSNGGEQFGTT